MGSPWKSWCWAGPGGCIWGEWLFASTSTILFQSKVGFSFLFLLLFHPHPYLSGIVTTWAIGANLRRHLLESSPEAPAGGGPVAMRAVLPCEGAETQTHFSFLALGALGSLPHWSRWIWGEMSVFKLQPCFWCPLLALFENSSDLYPHSYSLIMNLKFYLIIRILRVKNRWKYFKIPVVASFIHVATIPVPSQNCCISFCQFRAVSLPAMFYGRN